MFPRIRTVIPEENYKLLVTFDDGDVVRYDVLDDINTIKEFLPLKNELGLFNSVRLDESRTCVYWSDRIDLASDTIKEYGTKVTA